MGIAREKGFRDGENRKAERGSLSHKQDKNDFF